MHRVDGQSKQNQQSKSSSSKCSSKATISYSYTNEEKKNARRKFRILEKKCRIHENPIAPPCKPQWISRVVGPY